MDYTSESEGCETMLKKNLRLGYCLMKVSAELPLTFGAIPNGAELKMAFCALTLVVFDAYWAQEVEKRCTASVVCWESLYSSRTVRISERNYLCGHFQFTFLSKAWSRRKSVI